MNIKDIEGLAELARIDLSQAEKESLLKDLDSILGYVKQIEEVEVVPDVGRPELGRPTSGTSVNVWREDVAGARDFSRELIINQFPDKQDGFLKVKKIL
ncbi:MAG TPA: Asp-tRNA(Asn)/Glu-tRNA(Gln) amidotransferase subunit GatC [Candidatus Paceibacterota bacterium]